MVELLDERKVLERVIAECNELLKHADEDNRFVYETVDLVSEFKMVLDKKDRSLDGVEADIDTYFTKGAQELMGRGEDCHFYVDGRIVYALDWEGNQGRKGVAPGKKIEAQDMDRFIFMSFPCLSEGLLKLVDGEDGWSLSCLYGYDYFHCGSDLVLRGTPKVCEHALEVLREHGLNVDARPLDRAWLIFEVGAES